MKKIILTIFILNISLLFSEGQKIGYVNTQSIFAQNEDARLAHADVEKEAKRLQVEYENKAMTLDSLMRDYQKLELMLTDDMKTERQQEMQSLNAELENFQMKYFGQPDGEIFLMLQERMAPINALMQSAIDKVAAENLYDYEQILKENEKIMNSNDQYIKHLDRFLTGGPQVESYKDDFFMKKNLYCRTKTSTFKEYFQCLNYISDNLTNYQTSLINFLTGKWFKKVDNLN